MTTVRNRPVAICILADNTATCIFGDCAMFERCFPKPCDNCTVNLEQAAFHDEVTCFKTCKDWKDWKEWNKRRKK